MVLENTQASELDSSLALGYANPGIPGLASTPCIFDKTTNNTPREQLVSVTYCHPNSIKNKMVLENTQAIEIDSSLGLGYANPGIPGLASTPCILTKPQ